MPSDRVYVWTWLADRADPVVAGALDPVGGRLHFVYGRTYLERPDAVPMYLPELPLQPDDDQPPPYGMDLAGCLADGTPDAWGRRVILRRLHAGEGRDVDTAALPTVTYLLESGTDRIGANDFQASAETHVPRETDATLEELLTATDRLQAGEPFSEAIDRVLNAGSSVGGARPKATVTAEGGRALIAKFSTPNRHLPGRQGRGGRDGARPLRRARRCRDRTGRSRLETCIDAAREFLLSEAQACAMVDRKLLWRRAFLHPYAFEDYGPAPA